MTEVSNDAMTDTPDSSHRRSIPSVDVHPHVGHHDAVRGQPGRLRRRRPVRLLRRVPGRARRRTSTIRQHEITAFIGPSGCGKTTVLRCFNRMNDLIERPGRGQRSPTTASTSTTRPSTRSRSAGGSAWCSRSRTRSRSRSTTTSPTAPGSPASKGNMDDIVERALRGAALWDEVKDRLKASGMGLSGGQQQRLCIARAIAVDPEVILMDEPCSALDPIATGRIEDLMSEIKAQYTIVIVTHNMQQAARVSRPLRVLHHRGQRDERHPHRRAGRVRPHREDLLEPRRRADRELRHRPVRLTIGTVRASSSPRSSSSSASRWS